MSTLIKLSNVNVEFPVYSSKSRGLLNTILGYARSEDARIKNVLGEAISVRALRDISLTFNVGDKVGIVGKNGAGKTTLLRVLSGIYEPTSGGVEINARVSSLTDMFLGMDGDANGYENIKKRALFLGFSGKDLNRLIEDVQDFTELGPHLALPVRTYSTGMLLKLGFAISTAIRPDILIMDEMIGAGDIHFRNKAQARLDSLLGHVKLLVLASHDLSVIRGFCNKAILLKEGVISMQGEIDGVLSAYCADA